jgi:SAM-dependent methyltransferase
VTSRGYPPYPTRPLARSYDAAYRYGGSPNWDVGHPQPAFVSLAEAGLLGRRVLDVGCGTGELALYLARRGHRVVGIDFAPAAVAIARRKAQWRRLDVRFVVMDALDLPRLGLRFDAVTDSAMFHVLGGAERERFVDALAAVLEPGGSYFVLGDARPESDPIDGYGLSRREFHERFTRERGWSVEFVVETSFHRRWSTNPALLGVVRRRG